MKRTILIMIAVLVMVANVFAYVSAADIPWWSAETFSNSSGNKLRQWAEGIDGRVGLNPGTGHIYYVDSGVLSEGDGSSWLNARNTIQEAIDQSSTEGGADRGDIIYVAPGYTETVIAAGGINQDVIGLRIIGTGSGDNRPKITFTTSTAADWDVTAANCLIDNIIFINGIDSQVAMITVTADDSTISNCEFRDGSATSSLGAIVVGAADGDSDRLTVQNCTFYQPGGNNGYAIKLAYDMVGIKLIGNTIYGDFDSGAIYAIDSANVCLNLLISGNTITNKKTGGKGISVDGATSTIVLGENTIAVDDPDNAYSLDTATIQPARATSLGYSSIIDGTGVYPASVADDSLWAKVLSKSGTPAASSYNNTTDSLEAISDGAAIMSGYAKNASDDTNSLVGSMAEERVDVNTLAAGVTAFRATDINSAMKGYTLNASDDTNYLMGSLAEHRIDSNSTMKGYTLNASNDTNSLVGGMAEERVDVNSLAASVTAFRVTDINSTMGGYTLNASNDTNSLVAGMAEERLDVNTTKAYALNANDDTNSLVSSMSELRVVDINGAISVYTFNASNDTNSLVGSMIEERTDVNAIATRQITGDANVATIATRQIAGDANVVVINDRQILGDANVVAIATRQITGDANVAAIATRQITGDVNVAAIATRQITGDANVATILGGARRVTVGNWNYTDDTGADPLAKVIFTVTGDIMGQVIGICDVNLTSGGAALIQLGVADNNAVCIAQTTATDLLIDEIWHDSSPTTTAEQINMTTSHEFVISNGQDIIFSIGDVAITAGDIDFYLFWIPLSADAVVTAP